MKHYTKDQLLEAIKNSGGITAEIARRLGCDWMTARKYIERYRATHDAMIAENEAMLDQVERCAYDSAMAGDGPMIRYILSTKGKRRGWSEDELPQVAAGDPVIQIVFPAGSHACSEGCHDD